LAGYLVYFALGAALLTYLLTYNIRSTISVIIVAGTCGIAAATRLAPNSYSVARSIDRDRTESEQRA
jgi:hypothetical protein